MFKFVSGVTAVHLMTSLLCAPRAAAQSCPEAFSQWNCRIVTAPEADSISEHMFDDGEWNERFRGSADDCQHLFDAFKSLLANDHVFFTTSLDSEGYWAGDDIIFDDIVWNSAYAGTDIRRKTAIHETAHAEGCGQTLAIA